MTTRFAFILTVLPVAFASLAAFGQGTDELWETSMSMQMEGMTMPAMTQKMCKKKGSMEADKAPLEKDCKQTESKRTGNKFTFSFVCDGKDGKYSGSGETELLGKDAYRGKMKSSGVRDGEKFDMSTEYSGRRVGNCTWEDPGKKVEAMQAQTKAAMARECDEQIEKLNPMLVFGGANIPPESLYCKDRKADFCARSAKVAQQMREPAAFVESSRKYPEWREAMKACGTDPTAVSGPACKAATDKKDLAFVADYCPAEAKALAQKHCVGLDYTQAMATEYGNICGKYGADVAKEKVAAPKAEPAAAPKPGAAATPGSEEAKEPKQPTAGDTVKEGAKKLKKLLKF